MAAVLGSFATALALRHAEGLSASVEVLAVALSLSLGRVTQRTEHRGLRSRALAVVTLPLVALAANEIGTTILHHPDTGDALFVLALSAAIWLRRFGEVGRRIGTLATLPLVAMLIVPVPVVAAHGGGLDQRLWSALVAVIAFAWVTVTRALAERWRFVAADHGATVAAPAVMRAAQSKPSRRRVAASTSMALQMAVALGAAFAIGRSAFGLHWTWVVLSAFIVSSGNRGREDVAHKAAMRLLGAGAGTLAATVVADAFPAADVWSLVALFIVLALGVWLRQFNYAFWAAAMTSALALLYGYYGEQGTGLLATRLEGILVGACLGVAAAWLLLPIRVGDVMRRDVGAALAALDEFLSGLADPASRAQNEARFHGAVRALEHHAGLLRSTPRRLRAPIDHLPAIDALERCQQILPAISAAPPQFERHHHAHIGGLRREIGELRRANGRAELPEASAWGRLVERLRALPQALAGGGRLQAAFPDGLGAQISDAVDVERADQSEHDEDDLEGRVDRARSQDRVGDPETGG